jgi:hypothetical protein
MPNSELVVIVSWIGIFFLYSFSGNLERRESGSINANYPTCLEIPLTVNQLIPAN